MTNREKYIDGILALHSWTVVDGKIVRCGNVPCEGCLFYNEAASCSPSKEQWLKEEYTEPEVDWSKVEIDTPILVRDHEARRWCVRHFAEFKNGNVYAWEAGCTSWTAVQGGMVPWQQAKLAEESDTDENKR